MNDPSLHQPIAECLAEPEVSQSEHLPLLRQLVSCVAVVTTASQNPSPRLSLCLFSVLLRVAASRREGELREEVKWRGLY